MKRYLQNDEASLFGKLSRRNIAKKVLGVLQTCRDKSENSMVMIR